jgi:DNA polymerase-3 subunit alpha
MSQDHQNSQEKFAIRFGLGAIKAVGFGMMQTAIKEREVNGKFADIYDFAERLDPRSINKKSIEALAKAGAFQDLQKNRRQVAESFEILSAYSAQKTEAANSNQMSLFGGLPEANAKPELKKTQDWTKIERLQKEFEAFGYFLNEHPLDDNVSELKKRGVIFSDKLERDELEDGNLVKMAGVVAGSKHRSGPRGRFAYMTISDPYGIFEAMIFDHLFMICTTLND